VKGGSSAASFTLQIAAGQVPSLAGPIQATNLRAFVLAAAGSEAHLYGSMTGFQAKLDGKPAGNLGAAASSSKTWRGSHELILDGPTGQHDKMVFESQPTGAVYASLLSGANMGVLNIVASEDHADVFINGAYSAAPNTGTCWFICRRGSIPFACRRTASRPSSGRWSCTRFRNSRRSSCWRRRRRFLSFSTPAGQ